MRNGSDIAEEYWLLTTAEGRQLLASVAALRSFGPAELDNLRKTVSPSAISAAIRLTEGRARATLKFERGHEMWIEATAIQQATSEVIARHKARRFTSPLVVDLCAGLGGDAIALAERSNVIAVELDEGNCRRVRYNSAVYGTVDQILVVRARAENFSIPAGAWLHLDPDQRSTGGKRARSLIDYAPSVSFMRAISQVAAAGAIKLSPASDFTRHFSDGRYEIEVISLRGECKEATVWFGDAVTCQRRATKLPEGITWTDRGDLSQARASVKELASVIFDPDPSLIRAGLLDDFATVHGLARVGNGVDYLTGEVLQSTPFLTPFRVLETSPVDVKQLRRQLAARDIGTLEIKVRGLEIRPEQLRPALRLSGPRSASLLLYGGDGRAHAVLAERISGPSPV